MEVKHLKMWNLAVRESQRGCGLCGVWAPKEHFPSSGEEDAQSLLQNWQYLVKQGPSFHLMLTLQLHLGNSTNLF